MNDETIDLIFSFDFQENTLFFHSNISEGLSVGSTYSLDFYEDDEDFKNLIYTKVNNFLKYYKKKIVYHQD